MVARWVNSLLQGVTMRALSTIKHHIRVSDDARYLTAGQLRERYGVSDMWLWRHMRQHGFPKPVRFGGPTSVRHWVLSEIETWERDHTKSEARPQSEGVR
jgi:predicted DNA-binding transcriptional regulator AlpA